MKTKLAFLGISLFITLLLFAYIFLLNGSDPKSGIGIYFKLELVKYIAMVTGLICVFVAVGSTILKYKTYRNNIFYILNGVVNFGLGLYGIVFFLSHSGPARTLHEFLISLVIGVLLLADVFLF